MLMTPLLPDSPEPWKEKEKEKEGKLRHAAGQIPQYFFSHCYFANGNKI